MITVNCPKEVADDVFEFARFNYDISETENEDGTVTLVFDSPGDARKFQELSLNLRFIKP